MRNLKFKARVADLRLMYRTPWGRLREQILCEQLRGLCRAHFGKRRPRRLLDLGCGLGQYSAYLLRRGWHAALLDSSPEMLAASGEALRGIRADRYLLLRGDSRNLGCLPAAAYDLVMAHVLLEYLQEPAKVLEGIRRPLKKHGLLSLVYNQTLAAALFRLTRGKLKQAEAVLANGLITDGKMGPCRTYRRNDINVLLKQKGFNILWEKGLRVYCDYLPNRVKMGASGYRELLKLERKAAARPELLPLARMIHVVAKKA